VNLINESADSAARVPAIAGSDELANLAQRINGMLSSLEDQQKALRDSEFRWKFALEGAGEGVWDWNIQASVVEYSALWKIIFGYTEADVLPTKAEWNNLIHPEDRASSIMAMQAYLDGKTQLYVSEYRVRRKDNQYLWVLSRGMIVSYNAKGKPIRMLGTHTDIGVRKTSELDLKVAATAFESQEAMFITDADLVILRVNNAFSVMTGYTAEEAVGQKPQLLHSGKQDAAFYQAMWNSLETNGAWQGEIFNRRKNGEIYPEILTITAVKDDKGKVSHYVAIFTDITLRKAAEDEISHLAFYDPLTGLPNRRLLLDRLNQSMANYARIKRAGALLFLDLDHFKTLNDTLGHDVGDLLLKQVALRLQSCVRDCDTVARLGGDEFVIILENLSEQALEAASQTEEVGEKIIAILNQPYQLASYEYRSTASIGAVIIKDRNLAADEFLKQADIAMYQAKKAGRNTLRFFDPQMQANLNQQAEMERELYNALEQQQFRLYYQAQVDISGHITGAEALLRWIHPERGLVSPLQFIPLAEESGLILPIGLWVLKTACIQLQAWQQEPMMQDLELAVNVSAKQLRQADFSAQVQALVKQYAIRPQKLKLELTESSLLDNLENTIAIMYELNVTGVSFSLDDFGTGYSSLQYLKQLPISQLKIDQSFVCDIPINVSDDTIVRTIIAMAKSLNLDVIAEGVETKEQRKRLVKNGCKHFQGYLFSKPVPIEAFHALVAARPPVSL
jgi:diguanylate cyclase (GGDEF)-like protein/PAS domain S-box-containing protein